MMRIALAALVIFFCNTVQSFAANEVYTSTISGTSIGINQSTTVIDGQYYAMSAGVPSSWSFANANTDGYVEFGIDHNSTQFVSSGLQEFRVNLNLIYESYNYTTNSYVTSTITGVSLLISYNPNNQNTIDKVSYRVPGAHKLKAKIISFKDASNTVTVSAPTNAYLKTEINVERYHNFDHTVQPTGVTSSVLDINSDGFQDELMVSWDYIPGAEEYQLEYVLISSLTGTVVSGSPLEYLGWQIPFTDDDFGYNSTRISTTQQFYKIPLLYEGCFVLFRVRGVGKGGPTAGDYSYDMFGKWSTDDGLTKANLADYTPNVVMVHWYEMHETDLNWQVTSTFAEEGKRKDVISYFDGSLRNRQVVTKISSENNVVAGQTIYDYQGRPSVNVLPVPVNAEVISYQNDLAMYNSSTPYGREHFDKDDGSCGNILAMMDSTYSLASRYYSGNNDVAQSHQEFIPSAQGYPFTVVEYEPDNTGRIHAQSGVGLDHNLTSGHATQYFYGKPHQEQLDRLFGSEVGYAQHYKKNLVQDPNGQTSISYLDMQGRVIATALAGDTLTNLSTLTEITTGNSMAQYTELEIDLLNKTSSSDVDDNFDNNQISVDGKSLLYNGEEIVAGDAMDYEFTYSLTNTNFTDSCFKDGISYPLVYDLSLSLKDKCANEQLNAGAGINTTVNGSYLSNPTTGGSVSVSLGTGDGLSAVLNIGAYSITKTITVNEEALEYYANRYLNDLNYSCVDSLDDFYQMYLDSIQQTPCPMTCAECVTALEEALGTRASYIAGGANSEEQEERAIEWDNIYDDCNAPCHTPDICEVRYFMLLQDVSPGGQYGAITGDLSNSVFYENNLLVNVYTDPHHWKVSTLEYRDANGQLSMIPLQDLGFGTYSPAVSAGATITNINGIPHCKPQDLANVSDFLTYWRDEWAKTLVVFHPEYAYYELCIQNREVVSSFNTYYSSNDYDQTLLQTSTYSAAGSVSINGSSSFDWTDNSPLFELIENDPFFASTLGSSVKSDMVTEMNNYQGTTLDIFEYAALMIKCGTWYGPNYSTCMGSHTFGSDPALKDDEWQAAKSFYISLKQKYMQLAWDKYMVANFGPTENYYYCGCIGDANYNPASPSQPSGTMTVFFDYDQPCNFDHYSEYAYKTRRFGIPDLSSMVENADALMYQQTGLCPNALDLQNLLNDLAQTDKLKSTSEALFNHPAFNPDMYELLSGLDIQSNNYSNILWTGTPSGYNLSISLSPTGACSGSTFMTLTLPTASGLSWSNYPGTWSVTSLQSIYPSSSSAFSILAWIDHDNSPSTPDIDYVLTGSISSCVPLTGCTFDDACETSSTMFDMELLFNTLSADGLVNISTSLNSDTIYNSIIAPHLQSLFTGATLTWSNPSSGTFRLSDGTRQINMIFPSGLSSGDVISELQGNPAYSLPSNNYGGLVRINVDTFLTPIQITFYNGTSTVYRSAGDCDDPTLPSCEGMEYANLDELEIFLNSFFKPVGAPALNENSTVTGYSTWSTNFQNQLELDSADVFECNNGFIGDSIFYLPIVLSTDTTDVRCTISMEAVPNQPDISSFDFDNVTGISNVQPDYTQVSNDGNIYSFTATVTCVVSSVSTNYLVHGTSCFPIKVCNTCVPSPLEPLSCAVEYDQFDDYIKSESLPAYFSWADTTFCDNNFQYCVDDYLTYLAGMNIDDSTDLGYMLIDEFCIGSYGNYTADYLNYINTIFPSYAYNDNSNLWLSIDEFARGHFSSTCLEYFLDFASTDSSLTLSEYCEGYAIEVPCTVNPASNGFTWPEIDQPEIDCNTYAENVAMANAQHAFDAYVAALVNQFRQRYIDACIKQAVETFTMTYPDNEYHFTLYYYDQAGNLVRTVPPQGVNVERDATDLATIKTDRSNGTQTYKTSHSFTTTYTYNSLNQLTNQSTPDGGASTFWYDQLGRIVVSQNAKQETGDFYSYTRYDDLGRVTEAGQAYSTTAMSAATATNPSSLNSWLTAATLSEITKSYYDDVNSTVFASVPITQDNLRKRIAHTAYFTTEANMSSNDYESATHYTYDIHGNVNTLVQDIPGMENLLAGQQYKIITYQYDLVSGNVHEVAFQEGELDQYFHRYYYDSDNRITSVFTSTDDRHWDNDAKYFYYKHGPLSRKEIGNQKSQGEDYAYTIQGWIKGTNSSSLYASRDMGLDGKDDALNPNRYVANDVAAYSLHYFNGDYIAKAKSNVSYNADDFFLMQNSAASYLSTDAPNLYNGNIRSMVTTVRNDNVSGNDPVAMLTAYRYDQLNRIKQMKMYRDADLVNNEWGNGSSYANAFEEHYVYDFNGNILQQIRNGNSSTVSMDNLRYYYYKQDGSIFDPLSTVTPSNATNKLAYVTDAVSSGNYSNDIDNQSSGNYTYDEIGQLISDAQEEIASIEWTVTGKVKEVLRSSGSSKKDLEFVYDPMGHRIAKIVKPHGSTTAADWKYTYYILDASGNQMASYTKNETDYLYLQDQTIFGSSREGLINRNIAMDTSVLATTVKSNRIGDKQYQVSNHLGNVLSTYSDDVVADNGGSGSTIVAFKPVILSSSTYSSFGAPLEDSETNWVSVDYRYGFNGQEGDDEMKGDGNTYSFEARLFDPRLGKWLSCDPLENLYPELSPYVFVANNPLIYHDPDGRKIRGSISGLVNYFKYKAHLKKEISKTIIEILDGNLDPATVKAKNAYLTNLQKKQSQLKNLKDSKTVFYFRYASEEERNSASANAPGDVAVDQQRRKKHGKVDIILFEGQENQGMAYGSSVGDQFLNGDFSFKTDPNNRYAGEWGELVDVNDIEEALTDANMSAINSNSPTFVTDVENASKNASNLANKINTQRFNDFDTNLDTDLPDQKYDRSSIATGYGMDYRGLLNSLKYKEKEIYYDPKEKSDKFQKAKGGN